MPRPPSSFFVFLLFLLLGVVDAQNLTARLDLSALYSLRASLGIRARDWPRKVDPCANWVGVRCLFGSVDRLELTGLRRTRRGREKPLFAADSLRNLTRLSTFNASGFVLQGSIPEWLGSLGTLQVLDLAGCGVSGGIPASLGGLQSLRMLVLSRNRLDGPIPAALAGLKELERLDFAGNSLGGSVPEELGNISSLQVLNFNRNRLSGSLPVSIWALPKLRIVDVSYNNFTGMLPDEVAGFNASDGVLNISRNLYYGNISSRIKAALQGLRIGDISDNYFEGEVPPNVYSQLNCFRIRDPPGQRSDPDCDKFYSDRGMVFLGRRLPEAPPESSRRTRNHRILYILVGVFGGLILVAILVILLIVCLKKCTNRSMVNRQQERVAGSTVVPSIQGTPPPLGSSVRLSAVGDSFTYSQLFQATKNFSEINLIKHGHSGDLFLGALESGAAVVVKRVDAERISKEMYHVELDFFARVSHTRLVPFLGHCLEKESEKLLVYKYMPNRDLSNALYRKPGMEEEGLQSLDWITRLKIATGAAEALCYLHHECSPPIVHRDIQASSILLDDKFEVRLGSLSEVCTQEGEGNHNVISRLLRISQSAGASTSGSTPPTCAYDVYCLGKVLLELVTGKLGISASDDARTNEFIEHAMLSISTQEKEPLAKILDPSLIVDEDLMEEVWAMAIVAKSCLHPRASKRPQAKIILKALENPLMVVRDENAHSSARLRTTSSRGSWNAALFGSWRSSDKDTTTGPPRELAGQKSSDTAGSQGSVGEQSFNRRKPSKEIFPEPSSGLYNTES